MAAEPPGEEKFKAPLDGTPKITSPLSSYRFHLIMALVAVVILVGGYVFYYFQEQQMRQRIEGGLSIMAQLKVDQIVEWRAERLVDANVLVGSPFFAEGVEEYLASPTDAEAKDKVIARLEIIEKAYPYQDILLVNVNGEVLLSLHDSVNRLSEATLSQLAVAVEEGRSVIVDLHYLPNGEYSHLDTVVPLFPWGQDSPQAIGAVVFCIDPAQHLYPLLQSSPMPSETAETLLVERHGDEVLFLNELRHQKDTALKLRIPLSQQEVPAVMAVLGEEGVVEGKDYRGVEVLAALKHIPDSPWYLVAKIDISEALAAWSSRAVMILAFFTGLLVAALAGIGFIWQRRRRLEYQALYQAEETLRLSMERYRILFDININGLCVIDETMKVLLVNEAATHIFGFESAEEVLGVNPFDFVPSQERERVLETIKNDMFEKDARQINEFQLMNKSGKGMWVSAVGAVIDYQGKPAGLISFTDITERKRMEESLRRSERNFRDSIEESPLGIRIVNKDGETIYANRALLDICGYSNVEELKATPTRERYTTESYAEHQERKEKRRRGEFVPANYEVSIVRKSDEVRHLAVSRGEVQWNGKRQFQVVYQDITERKRAEEKIRLSERHLQDLLDLHRMADSTPEAIMNHTLEASLTVLRSQFAFIGIMSSDESVMTIHAWSKEAMERCAVTGKPVHFPIADAGLWGEVVRQRRTIMVSDYDARSEYKKGYPEGHVPITRFLSVPIFSANKIVAVAAVANKMSEYDEADVNSLTSLLHEMWNLIEHKQVEETLRQSEEKYRTILKEIEDSYFEVDLAGNLTFVNDAMCLNLRYSREELLGMNYRNFTTEEDIEHVFQTFNRVYRTGKPNKGFTWKIIRKDGSIGFADASVSPLRSPAGEINGFRGVGRDITERKRAETSLRESEVKYRSVTEQSLLGLIVIQDFRVVFANAALAEISGFSVEELLSLPPEKVQALVHPEDQALVWGRLRERLAGKPVSARYEYRGVRKDGEIRWLEMHANRTEYGGKPAVQGAIMDITERKRAEEALRESEAKHRTLFETMTQGVVYQNADGCIFSANAAAERILGLTLDQMQGRISKDPRWKAIHEDGSDFPGDTHPAMVVLKTGKEIRNAIMGVFNPDKNGYVWIDIHAVPQFKPGEKEPYQVYTTFADITERKRAEEEKKQLELKAQIASRLASVGEMAAGVAHEINNPLTAVTGYAQLLMDREDIPPDMRSDLEAINDGAQRVAGIVQRLLAFSRQTRPERRLVDINELIESTLILRAYHLKVNNIEVTTKLAADLLETVIDPGQIQQVLLNLIVNAETAMKLAHGKGKLTITTEKSHDTIKICIKDDGPGIKPEVMDWIFDPFFTTREVGQGTGLGLSLCYGIVMEHKGRIYVESRPGKGANFIVELPVITEAKPPKPAEPDVRKSRKKGKGLILAVDDERVVRDVVNRVLTGEGHKVETVDNAAEALKKIEGKRYNLILVDIKMPGMNGVELYKRIQKIDKSLARRVVFMTGDIMSADTEKFLAETKVAHIEKPFDAEQLTREARRALSGSR